MGDDFSTGPMSMHVDLDEGADMPSLLQSKQMRECWVTSIFTTILNINLGNCDSSLPVMCAGHISNEQTWNVARTAM